jgi:hypothetical protein
VESKGAQQLWSATTTRHQRGLSLECSVLRFALADDCRLTLRLDISVHRFGGESSVIKTDLVAGDG